MGIENWHLYICGMSHKNSTLSQRQVIQLGRDDLSRANLILTASSSVLESIVVSTCNRIEFYFVAEAEKEPFEIVSNFFDKFKNIDISNWRDSFYIKKDQHAAAHLFRVAAGLDSMVVGEDQIVSQLKEDYSLACRAGTAGKILHRLFHQAFRTGKQVRSDTEIGQGACSISSAAVELLKSKIGPIDTSSVLFIGVNQMIALAAGALSDLGAGKCLFANRTIEKAQIFVSKYGGSAYSLENLPDLLTRADIIISCTGSKLPIVTKTMMDDLLAAHSDKRLLIIDLAIPRDIEVDGNLGKNIAIFDLDDIHKYIQDKQQKRERAIPEAEIIIGQRLSEFMYWFAQTRREPIYGVRDESFETIYEREMAPLLKELSPESRQEFERALHRMLTRFMQLKLKSSFMPFEQE